MNRSKRNILDLFFNQKDAMKNKGINHLNKNEFISALKTFRLFLLFYPNDTEVQDHYKIAYKKLKAIKPDIKFESLEVYLAKLKKRPKKEAWLLQKVKKLAKNFIKEKYPDELRLFEVVWNAIKNKIKDFLIPSQKALPSPEVLLNALSPIKSKKEEEEYATPIVIVTLVEVFREFGEQIYKIENTELISKIKKIAKENNASEKLASEISEYVVKQITKHKNKKEF